MKCAACGKSCRTRSRAVVLDVEGNRAGLVCGPCASGGTTIVAAMTAKRGASCKCGDDATICAACSDKRIAKPDDMRKAIAKKLRDILKAYSIFTSPPDGTRVDGLQQAIDLVEGWGRTNEARTGDNL